MRFLTETLAIKQAIGDQYATFAARSEKDMKYQIKTASQTQGSPLQGSWMYRFNRGRFRPKY